MRNAAITILLAVSLFVATACQHQSIRHNSASALNGDIRQYAIAVDRDGVAHDPLDYKHKYTPEEFRVQVNGLLSAMDHFHASHSEQGKPLKILIFAHGGLNSPTDALFAADGEIDQLLAAGYFPIFINWESDLYDSYSEHLLSVTQGNKSYDHPFWRGIQSPLYFVADLGRAVVRAPVVWINQIMSDIAAGAADLQAVSDPGGSSGEKKDLEQRWTKAYGARNVGKTFAELLERYEGEYSRNVPENQREEIQISLGRDLDRIPWHMASLAGVYVLTLPTKFGTSWILDGLGKSAWDNMSRRTQTMYEGKAIGNPNSALLTPTQILRNNKTIYGAGSSLDLDRPATFDWDSTGAVDYLKHALAVHVRLLAPNDAWAKYEITLVGHSMGAMVLNEWIRRNYEDGLFYRNIVYMAAACSFRGFENTVVPYLRTHRGTAKHPESATRFFDLTLYPTADLREKNHAGGDIPVRGSLLVWIDEFLADPATPLDRTLGRWDNILQCAFLIPPDVRGQITIKGMSLSADDRRPGQGGTAPDPQSHGSFRSYHLLGGTLLAGRPSQRT